MSEKLYTDEELCWATQVAYCDVHKYNIAQHYKEYNDYPTLQVIFSDLGYSAYYDQKLLTSENAGDKLLMEETAKQFIDDVIAGKICQGWKVVSVSDERQEDIGFYGLTIETGDDNAIIAFRGSESVDPNQFIEDWIVADFGIINGKMTEQGLAAAEYVKSVGENFDYDNFALTGHSLGGNLALAATIYSATEDFDSDMCTRIKQAVSFDGPGHPDEFFAKYQKEIDQMAGVMTHIQWSMIGAIFTSLCEENGTYIKMVSDKMESLVYKHSTASLEFKNGTLEKAERFDPLANAVHYITVNIDDEEKVQYFTASLINCVIEGSQRFYDLSEKHEGVFSTEPYLNYVSKTTNLLIALSLYNTIYNGKPAGSLGISENDNRLQEAVRKSLVGYVAAVNEFSHDVREKPYSG